MALKSQNNGFSYLSWTQAPSGPTPCAQQQAMASAPGTGSQQARSQVRLCAHCG